MSLAIVTGTFINAGLKTTEYEGKKTYTVQVDLYQEENPRSEKMLSVKVEDAELLSKFQNEYKIGDLIAMKVLISSYKNSTYYKFLDFADAAGL